MGVRRLAVFLLVHASCLFNYLLTYYPSRGAISNAAICPSSVHLSVPYLSLKNYAFYGYEITYRALTGNPMLEVEPTGQHGCMVIAIKLSPTLLKKHSLGGCTINMPHWTAFSGGISQHLVHESINWSCLKTEHTVLVDSAKYRGRYKYQHTLVTYSKSTMYSGTTTSWLKTNDSYCLLAQSHLWFSLDFSANRW